MSQSRGINQYSEYNAKRFMGSTSPIHTSGPNKLAFAAKGGGVSQKSENDFEGVSSLERVPQSLNGHGSRI